LMGFREELCELRSGLFELDLERADRAHGAALVWARKFDDPDKLFSRRIRGCQ